MTGYLLLLSVLGVIEAVVLLYRYRSAVKDSASSSAFWTFNTCAVRLAFIYTGVQAVMKDIPWVYAILAYCIPASAITYLIHRKR